MSSTTCEEIHYNTDVIISDDIVIKRALVALVMVQSKNVDYIEIGQIYKLWSLANIIVMTGNRNKQRWSSSRSVTRTTLLIIMANRGIADNRWFCVRTAADIEQFIFKSIRHVFFSRLLLLVPNVYYDESVCCYCRQRRSAPEVTELVSHTRTDNGIRIR